MHKNDFFKKHKINKFTSMIYNIGKFIPFFEKYLAKKKLPQLESD